MDFKLNNILESDCITINVEEVDIVSLDSQRDQGTEEFIDTLENNHIYRDMRAKYDELTDDGEKVFLDEYDELASEYISIKHGITKEEALSLYIKFETKISEFHQRRLKSK